MVCVVWVWCLLRLEFEGLTYRGVVGDCLVADVSETRLQSVESLRTHPCEGVVGTEGLGTIQEVLLDEGLGDEGTHTSGSSLKC